MSVENILESSVKFLNLKRLEFAEIDVFEELHLHLCLTFIVSLFNANRYFQLSDCATFLNNYLFEHC